MPHVPVLMEEALDALALKPGGRYLDGTFGAGGYSRALLLREPQAELLALDRDPNAIAGGAGLVATMAGRLTLAQARFGALAEEAERFGMLPIDIEVKQKAMRVLATKPQPGAAATSA